MNKLTPILLLFCFFSNNIQAQQSYEDLWKKVYQFELDKLPKSAVAIVNTIHDKAVQENNSQQLIKSIIYQSKFLLVLEENAQLKVIERLQEQAAKQSFPSKNILHNILAYLYWEYFKEHRWQFYNRTQLGSSQKSKDFRTWDLTTLFKEIQHRFTASLNQAQELQALPITQFKTLLKITNSAPTYQPSLYDFLAQNALSFYKSSERSITQPAVAFTVDNPDYVKPLTDFLSLNIKSDDPYALPYRALALYQELLKFHQKTQHLEALAYNDLQRLYYVKNEGSFPLKTTLFETALQTQIDRQLDDNAKAHYQFALANHYHELASNYHPYNTAHQFKNKEALKLCTSLLKSVPNHKIAASCKRLIKNIELVAINITSEKFLPINTYTRALINYKNTQKLYMAIYKITPEAWDKITQTHGTTEQVQLIQQLPRLKHWSTALKKTDDYQTHSTEIGLPKLAGGQYLLVAHNSPSLTATDIYGYTALQVTNLVLIENHQASDNFQVVNRQNGKPIAGASVVFANEPTRHHQKKLHKKFTTNRHGAFSFVPEHNYYSNVKANVRYKNDRAQFGNFYLNPVHRSRKNYEDKARTHSFLFTDRSIYRPGQTVYFKGIALQQLKTRTQVLAAKKVTVIARDPNYQIIETKNFETNDFGSFHGNIQLPFEGITGSYALEVIVDGKTTHEYISMEAYKRPKFKAAFTPLTSTFKINDRITLPGKATAYSGANISKAKVVYRVHRRAVFPEWWYWSRPQFTSQAREIAQGETTTDSQGNFSIHFTALPDASIDPKSLPTFKFEIHADITDLNGETQSTQKTISVGYHSIVASITMDDQLNNQISQEFNITTKNLAEQFVSVDGDITIHKLQAPERILRERPWQQPEFQTIAKADFIKKYPHDAYGKEDDYQFWKLGKLTFQKKLTTKAEQRIAIPDMSKWTPGKYLVQFNATDADGNKVLAKKFISVFDTKASTPADNAYLNIQADKASYQPGDTAKIAVQTNTRDGHLVVVVEKDYKIYKRYYLRLRKNQQVIEVPVTKEDLGGFAIKWYGVFANSIIKGNETIKVPYPATQLDIETVTFRDKLLPGNEEQWTFNIRGPQQEKVTAEVLASMYDASLDTFAPHDWNFTPIRRAYYSSYHNTQANHSISTVGLRMRNQLYPERISPFQPVAPLLKNFGFSFHQNQWIQNQYLQLLKALQRNPDGTLTGIVSDHNGPLGGVSILLKGTTLGTQTNFDGVFNIPVKVGDTLIISFIGFETLEYTITDMKPIAFQLKTSDETLDEVVMIAHGKSERRFNKALSAQGNNGVTIAEPEADITSGWVNTNDLNIKEKKTTSPSPARKNLKETAFFYPQLRTDDQGKLSFSFKAPEALTTWKLQLLAYDKQAHSAVKSFEAVTQKKLMISPNAPRFMRQGDVVRFSAKIDNLSEALLQGTATLDLTDPTTGAVIPLQNFNAHQSFSITQNQSVQVSWTFQVPQELSVVQYKITAKAGQYTDGEQALLPVLSSKKLVTETLPLWTAGNESNSFRFNKLVKNKSKSLEQHQLTLELTSNPTWYAVKALPFLMEGSKECSEQVFARLYANALAEKIVSANPAIQTVFKQWKNSKALLSPLEKNQELKALTIQETPWLREAQSESAQRKRLGLLFDKNNLNNGLNNALRLLEKFQLENGGFPWYQGGRYPNSYITLHIASGLGHLKKLGVTLNTSKISTKALRFLDNEIVERYESLQKEAKKIAATKSSEASEVFLAKNHLNSFIIGYLYLKSLYPDSKSTDERCSQAIAYYAQQSTQFWQEFPLASQAMIALVHQRNHSSTLPKNIMKSLHERSIHSKELGRYWKANKPNWHWYQSPIETQALLIEAFAEITKDTTTVDELKLWLLKNKQVHQWKTSKATTEAVYALLQQGSYWIANTELPEVTLGTSPLTIPRASAEAGSGYFKKTWSAKDIRPELGTIRIKANNNSTTWGAMYWQYFEELDNISAAATTLKIRKKYYKKVHTAQGPKLIPITEGSPLAVGDLLTIRLELQTDRDLSFVHLKDGRASGVEPLFTPSEYHWQDGLYYYQNTQDAATNFFFDRLPKGIYVFEYDVRANNAGNFSGGISELQCMYAPEFNSHSKGIRLQIAE